MTTIIIITVIIIIIIIGASNLQPSASGNPAPQSWNFCKAAPVQHGPPQECEPQIGRLNTLDALCYGLTSRSRLGDSPHTFTTVLLRLFEALDPTSTET